MVFANIAKAIFGSANDRQVKKLSAQGRRNQCARAAMAKLTDAELRAKTAEFRAQLAQGTKLDDLLVPAFAVVREASKRVLGMRHFDVQLVGGMVLNERAIAEMRTGEGKTLVATLPGLSQRPHRPGRPRRHRQRLPRQARRRLDGPGLQIPRPDRRHHRPRPLRRRAQGRPTPPTSPMAPTTNSASTTCATT